MTPLLLNEPCMMLIVVGEFLSACLQVVHLFMVVFRASSRPGWLSCAYEAAVQLHLGIALCITVGTGVIRAPLLAEVLGFSRFFWLLWANAAFSFIALAFALYFSRAIYGCAAHGAVHPGGHRRARGALEHRCPS